MTEVAGEDFWRRVRTLLDARGGLLLEETRVRNATLRHRLTAENPDGVRPGLGPRALLAVRPDLVPAGDGRRSA
ncbi:hypothetical protein ACVW0K_004209 [Streptomyces filamentosus]